MSHSQHDTPRVFISSTSEDLVVYREAAKEAAMGAEMMPVMMEYFTAAGDRPPLAACLAEVDRADLLVVLVAHRYGWVPGDQDGGENKSITWLECERAAKAGKEVLAFILDDSHPWPADRREENRIAAAVLDGKATTKLLAEVKRNVQSLHAFKQWLDDRAIRAQFTTPETLQLAMFKALHGWRSRHAEFAAVTKPASPDRYLRWLRDQSPADAAQAGSLCRLARLTGPRPVAV